MKNDDSIWRGKRVWVKDGNTEIHAVWYGVYVRGVEDAVASFSGDSSSECEEARKDAIGYAKDLDRELK